MKTIWLCGIQIQRMELGTCSDSHSMCYNNYNYYYLRELFYDRNPGDARVKVGSERQAATSPSSPNVGVDEIGYTTIWNLRGGTLQIWPCYMGSMFLLTQK